MKNMFEFVSKTVDLYDFIQIGIIGYLFLKNHRSLTLDNFRAFCLKHDKKIQWFFGVSLLGGSFLMFGIGVLLCGINYLLNYPTWKLIMVLVVYTIEAGIFYWMAPPIPKLKFRISFE
jgi:hypothetical protein